MSSRWCVALLALCTTVHARHIIVLDSSNVGNQYPAEYIRDAYSSNNIPEVVFVKGNPNAVYEETDPAESYQGSVVLVPYTNTRSPSGSSNGGLYQTLSQIGNNLIHVPIIPSISTILNGLVSTLEPIINGLPITLNSSGAVITVQFPKPHGNKTKPAVAAFPNSAVTAAQHSSQIAKPPPASSGVEIDDAHASGRLVALTPTAAAPPGNFEDPSLLPAPFSAPAGVSQAINLGAPAPPAQQPPAQESAPAHSKSKREAPEFPLNQNPSGPGGNAPLLRPPGPDPESGPQLPILSQPQNQVFHAEVPLENYGMPMRPLASTPGNSPLSIPTGVPAPASAAIFAGGLQSSPSSARRPPTSPTIVAPHADVLLSASLVDGLGNYYYI